MSSRILAIRSKLETVFTSISNFTPKLPERFKGTIVEKWANYWKNLLIDYKEVALDVVKETKEKPLKTGLYGTGVGMVYICTKKNPDKDSFIAQLRKYNAELIQVHESNHRKESANHIQFLERCLNEGIVRRLSLGVVSFIWLDNYDKGVALYKAMCPYLQPEYLTFHERIIDVGFWDRWWKLDEKMIDFDVNF